MAKLKRTVKIFPRQMGVDDWALAVNGAIVETGTRAQMEASYEKWVKETKDE